MPDAVVAAVAGPVVSSVLQDVLGNSGSSSSGGGGLFGSLLGNVSSLFSGLLNTASPLGPSAGGVLPYSTSQMSPAAYNNPMSYIHSIVRDHRHPTTSTWTSSPAGDNGDSAALNSAQAAADQAQQKMEQNPDNMADQLAYQKAQQALQNLFTTLSNASKEKAEAEKQAAQASLLN
jgi:hypothetical protein